MDWGVNGSGCNSTGIDALAFSGAFFPPALSFQTERLFVNQLSMIQFQRSRGNVKETRTTYYKVWAGPIDHFPPVFLAAFCFAELGFRFARGLSGNTCARSA